MVVPLFVRHWTRLTARPIAQALYTNQQPKRPPANHPVPLVSVALAEKQWNLVRVLPCESIAEHADKASAFDGVDCKW